MKTVIISLARFGYRLIKAEAANHQGNKSVKVVKKHDWYQRAILVLATLASIGSFAYFYSQGDTMSSPDAESHLLIAERVLHSPTAGFAQLGGVWLPLPHLLMLPFLILPFGIGEYLYQTGIAGSLISMVAFVLCCWFLYKLTTKISSSQGAGLVASLLFISNPNILYMQSTAMTELPLFMFIVATIYFLVEWCHDTDKVHYLLGMVVATILATLTRYEGWVLMVLVIAALVYVGIRKGFSRQRLSATLLYAANPLHGATLGPVSWMIWNTIIFHNPLNFQNGEYSKPSLWVGVNEKAVGNLWISWHSYQIAVLQNLGWAVCVLGLIGLAFFLKSNRVRPEKIAVLALLFPLPFFVLMLYLGQRPMHVREISGDLYNVRFALSMLLPAVVFVGYLVRKSHLLQATVLGAAILSSLLMVREKGLVTLEEPQAYATQKIYVTQRAAADWLRKNYDQGFMLIESYGNEEVQVKSGIPTEMLLYEGSYKLWGPAQKYPDQYVDWILMRASGDNKDKVYLALKDTPMLTDNFVLVFQNQDIEIYKKRS